MTSSISPISLDQLRSGLEGRVVGPDDPDFDELRRVLAGGVTARPAAVVRVANAEDVARIVSYARATGTELAVRCGGHSGAGHGTTDGGIVIDLRELKRIDIDGEARIAWADAGLTAIEVAQATAEHGLAIGFGDTGSVGIGGITLGGGIGYLVRKHGLTIDSLIGAEIVTADGRIRSVDADHEPDLFWAIRGGGGNFGVVTRFRFRLHPLERIIGGMLVQPLSPEGLVALMEAAAAAPDELSAIVNVMGCPPMPMIPEELHGTPVLFSLVCWSGDLEEGERVLGTLREIAEPIADLVAPITYPELFPPEEMAEEYPVVVGQTLFMDRIGLQEARAIAEAIEASDAPMRAVQLRPLGGAMARVAADATAFAHRSSAIMAIVVSFVEGSDAHERRARWVHDLAGTLRQEDPGAYVNFLEADDPDGVHAAYPPPTWERLARIKAEVDPTNLFHRNHNIPPATNSAA
ncbi:MAG TPA: FAD-binding oxidoreductase [Candidatus Angelobacter sp.]|nr:FAD-binding oxidoreductase [Candidatus Angelobacter sp.]